MDLTLVILAAGMGSRYGGSKQTEPMGPTGEMLMDYSLFDAIRAGFTRVIFIIREDFPPSFRETVEKRMKGKIAVDYAFQQLDDLPAGFSVPKERKKPWGTAHALLTARQIVNEPFLSINADDFYGAEAYRLAADFLRKPPQGGKPEWALVGYTLRETLSRHGHVSRGVCSTDSRGMLTSIEEHQNISWDGDRIVSAFPGGKKSLTGEEIVSMNCWAFFPDVFPVIGGSFSEFLRGNGSDPKAECFLPLSVNSAVSRGIASARILKTSDKWFGVTYREETPLVQASIREMIKRGEYPEKIC